MNTRKLLENPYPPLMVLRLIVMICISLTNFFLPTVIIWFNVLAICVFIISTIMVLRIPTLALSFFILEFVICLIYGIIYYQSDFPYPLLIGLVGVGLFLYHDGKIVTFIWSFLIIIMILLEFVLILHQTIQIIINYSFVLFASVTGGLLQYAYRMKNKTLNLFHELEVSYEKLQAHAQTVEQLAMQEERNRIAREIHDTVGHTVTSLVFQLEAARKLFTIDQTKSLAALETSEGLARSIYQEIRFSIEANGVSDWEGEDLQERLKGLIQNFSRLTHLEVFSEWKGDSPSLLSRMYTFAIYRILQETLTNAKRHGNANKAWIMIEYEDNLLQLMIKDDGIGCKSVNMGFGLRNIQNRVKELNGTCSFLSEKGNGFKTRVVIPIVQREEVQG
ncbi:sensor histidine kinase [Shimazuella sp. AN120528]|uniref:sensor histidine kinase n=1 Tax=Shimazuella soli TaxID=1892854 RepID=UPI001F10BCDF|nr:sensor histidine kinase [Shimazuella soli]MCH5585764.1 sensor histidine kinase [Shimazuella soli]